MTLTAHPSSPAWPLLFAWFACAGCTCGTKASPSQLISNTPAGVDFGNVASDASALQQVTLTNTGQSTLTISSIELAAGSASGFQVTGSATSLSPGKTTQLVATFTAPAVAGNAVGQIEIDSDALNAPKLLVSLAATVPATCANSTCPPDSTCTDSAQGPVCTCSQGFTIVNGACTDLCDIDNGGCDPNATCSSNGTTVTCTCNLGFSPETPDGGTDGGGVVCSPDNACVVNNGGCDPHATCMPNGIDVTCTCDVGYAGNGQVGPLLVCTPIDQCTINNGGCDPNSTCTPDGTGVTCTCDPGFHSNGLTGTAVVCTPYNPCDIDDGDCDPFATCSPAGGSAVNCTCIPGYEANDGGLGPEVVCSQINQCTINNGGCSAHASCSFVGPLNEGQVECQCDVGYRGDGLSCVRALAGHPSTINEHVCNIAADDTLWCWGANSAGQVGNPTPTASGTIPIAQYTPWNVLPGVTWASVAAGYAHTCGVQADGSLWCWGDNSAGELANGAVTSGTPSNADLIANATPGQVGAASTWTLISAGWNSSCGIQNDGSLWCWGDNTHGEAGVPSANTTSVTSPSEIPAQTGVEWTAVVCGNGFACGLQSDESLWCWGESDSGQLGMGIAADSSVPIQVGASIPSPGTDTTGKFLSLSAGDQDACAIRDDNTLWCWGWGPAVFATFSPGSTGAVPLTPTEIDAGPWQWASVAVGTNACALRTDGSLWCTGPNQFGNLSTGDLIPRTVLSVVGFFATWQGVAVGASTCAETVDGLLYCWGSDDLGEVGDGATPPDQPSQVAPGKTWLSVALGAVRDQALDPGWPAAYAVRSDGTLWEWGGYEPFGASTVQADTPQQVGVGKQWTSVVAGDPIACAFDNTQNPSCFGTTDVGNDSNAPTATATVISSKNDWTAAAVGLFNGCGLEAGGVRSCWGTNADGEFGDGSITGSLDPDTIGSMSWTSVVVGAHHACGMSAGALWCWGANSVGQLGTGGSGSLVPMQLPGGTWTSVSAGFSHTCAIEQGGALSCWGQNAAGEVGNGSTLSQPTPAQVAGLWNSVVTAIDSASTCGIQTDGSLWCWGSLSPIIYSSAQSTPSQLGSGSTWSSVAVAGIAPGPDGVATNVTVCAIRSDQTLWCWGDNLYGQRGNDQAWQDNAVSITLP